MIEKKISYEINIEKPSKTKPVKQGGVFNYLGKQKTVNAPRHWRSSPKHPIAHLSYITKDEEKILIDLNLYGSLKGKPNKGPFGLPSLQGSGGGAGGDGGSSGGDSGGSDSGPGGSDDGSSQGVGSGEGESTGDANDQGGTEGPSGTGVGAEGGFGIGPDAAAEAAQSVTADDVSAQAQADQEDAATAAAAAEADTGIMGALSNIANRAVQNVVSNPVATAVGLAFGPVAGLAARAISSAVDAANRGVTGPSDDTQESTSVQSEPAQSAGGDGGITTLPQYAPLYNQATGDPLLDSLIARYKMNPASFGIT